MVITEMWDLSVGGSLPPDPGYALAFPQPTVPVSGGGGGDRRGGCHLGSCVFLLTLCGPAISGLAFAGERRLPWGWVRPRAHGSGWPDLLLNVEACGHKRALSSPPWLSSNLADILGPGKQLMVKLHPGYLVFLGRVNNSAYRYPSALCSNKSIKEMEEHLLRGDS